MQYFEDTVVLANQYKCHLIFLSSNLVFEGSKQTYYENDQPLPYNNMGVLYHKKETYCIANLENYSLLRLSSIFGFHNQTNNDILGDIINKLSSDTSLELPNYYYTNYTYIEDISLAVLKILEKDKKGIFNIACKDAYSLYNMAIKIADIFNLNKDLIKLTNNIDNFVKLYPEYCSLDTSKASFELGIKISTFDNALLSHRFYMNRKKRK